MNKKSVSIITPVLWKASIRYLTKHRWQSLLMILGIALGVAVVVSIDLANASAKKAFELSKEVVIGRATHQIIGGPQGLDDRLFTQIRLSNLPVYAAPIIQRYVSSPQLGNRPFELLGIDPFSDYHFRDYLGDQETPQLQQMTLLLTQPGAILITQENAQRYELKLGDEIELDVAGKIKTASIVGFLKPVDGLSKQALEGIILTDIATAQELTDSSGSLDRIDLILFDKANTTEGSIQGLLPQQNRLTVVSERVSTIETMTAAFALNLQALSLLALVVGLFLIYNTMTFSVVRRRELFGMLRCLGVTRHETFLLIITEAFLVGIAGSILGIGLGILMGRETISMVSQTINDLYYTTTVQSVNLPWQSLVKGAIVGVGATIVTAVFPAWEASTIPARAALSRAGLENKALRAVIWTAPGGLLSILLGVGLFALPVNNLYLGFGGTTLVVVGFAMLSPITMTGLMRVFSSITGWIFGLLGRMAPRNLVKALSRTSIAVAALMLSVSVVIGMSLMIESFRHTVNIWLEETLQGDIYISAPSFIASTVTEAIQPEIVEIAQNWEGVESIYFLRTTMVDSSFGEILLSASSNRNVHLERYLKDTYAGADKLGAAMDEGAVMISETLAHRLNIEVGDIIKLRTANGLKDFPIHSIFFDYASSGGSILMRRDIYQQYWQDNTITAIDLRMADNTDVSQVKQELERAFSDIQKVIVRPNMSLRTEILAIFDRTFAITSALRILATIVAFIGVLNALLLLQMEKQREMGILRTLGLTGRQLWVLVMLETGLMGFVAGLLAMPTGYALTIILIEVINRRSFGWTLQLSLTPEIFLGALAVSMIAALLAGVYPAWHLSHMTAAEAIRYE